MAIPFPVVEHVRGTLEVVQYVFDFRVFPEIAAGETITSCSVPAVAGLTIGTAAVIAAVTDGVPARKGVQVTISGGTAGTRTISCYAVTSGGSTREIRLEETVG